ncbi:MAG: PDZ domain-containing protein, partial [Acidimicrobiales bacterium]
VLHGTVQTDAPVDSIALGGPLTDDQGVVVGLLATATSGGIGGNAVPIATALSVGEDIAEDGFARHVWLGIEGSDLDATRAAELHLTGGARVSHVNEQSPAAGCDLRDGDVITAVDGREVTSMSDLVVSLSAHRPGDTIVVEYWRDSELRTATATLVERSG